MKKVFLMLTLSAFVLCASAQVTPYVSTGVSLTNGNDFKNDNYFSAEVGVMNNNYMFGLVLGKGTFNLESDDNYFYELKLAPYKALTTNDRVGIYMPLGIGGYFREGSPLFIEYGLGASYNFDNISVWTQYSNWDAFNYVSIGVSKSL